MNGIDFTSLGKALGRLREGLEAIQREPENLLYRDAAIQRFEFTYGLCATLLERYLAHAMAQPPEQKMSFPTLIRTGSELGLLRSGWERWSVYREARNRTSHVYNEEIAARVVEVLPDFALEAEALYTNLSQAAARDGY